MLHTLRLLTLRKGYPLRVTHTCRDYTIIQKLAQGKFMPPVALRTVSRVKMFLYCFYHK